MKYFKGSNLRNNIHYRRPSPDCHDTLRSSALEARRDTQRGRVLGLSKCPRSWRMRETELEVTTATDGRRSKERNLIHG